MQQDLTGQFTQAATSAGMSPEPTTPARRRRIEDVAQSSRSEDPIVALQQSLQSLNLQVTGQLGAMSTRVRESMTASRQAQSKQQEMQ